MAGNEPTVKKTLVSTVRGPQYRYVSEKNLSRYGRVGRREGEAVVAKKRYVESQPGQISYRAVSAPALRERFAKGTGGIFYRPSVAPSPAPEKPRDVEEDIRRDMEETERRYQPPPTPRPAPGEKREARVERRKPKEDIFSDPDPRRLEESTPTGRPPPPPPPEGIAGPVKKYRVIAETGQPAVPSARRQPAEQPIELGEQQTPEAQPQQEWIIVENSHMPVVYDEEGNPILDEQGNAIHGKLEPFISPEKRAALYEPVRVQGRPVEGKTYPDAASKYRVYRRTKSVVARRLPLPTGSQLNKPLGKNTQIVIEGTVTDENGVVHRVIGRSHTMGGAIRFGHGYTDSSPTTRYDEAVISLKKDMHSKGISYENTEEILARAFQDGTLEVNPYELTY